MKIPEISDKNKEINYKPLTFIIITFIVSWSLVFFEEYQTIFPENTNLRFSIFKFVDFLISASPLLVALILLRKPFFYKRKLFFYYVFGSKPQILPYTFTIIIFIFQFLAFYFFGKSHDLVSIKNFLNALQFQILFGGGLEEGGWRGYLQPAFEKKFSVIISSLLVGTIWAFWHLPYFFLPGNHQGHNFLLYLLTCIVLAFTLTAIYKLTKSILVCTLFHGFINTLAVTIGADFSNFWFLFMFIIQAIISIVICLVSQYLHKDFRSI